MKKNIVMRVASLILVCTIVSTCFVGSTFAKYTSSIEGSSSAVVAKWAVKVNGKDIVNEASEVKFELFDKSGVYQLAGVTGSLASAATNDDANVKDGTDNAIVAPGTWGKVTFQVVNDSDVNAEFSVKVKSITTTLPLEFSVDGLTFMSAEQLKASPVISGDDTTLDMGATKDVALYWRWAFDGNDTTDTNLGAAGTATCDITVEATFTQVD